MINISIGKLWVFRHRFKRSRRGFTLVELLIVIALVGILATAILIAINPAKRIGQAYDAQRKSHLASIAHALQVQYVDRLAYPDPGLDLFADSTEGSNWIPQLVPDYLKTLPTDPKQGGGPSIPLIALFGNFDVLAGGNQYYVDCNAATNGNGSAGSPWNKLASPNGANSAPLAPGDSLLFRRGSTCVGQLKANWNGNSSAYITIGAYGGVPTDPMPIIKNGGENVLITGSYLIIENIDSFNDNPPLGYEAMDPSLCPVGWPIDGSGKVQQPKGWSIGFRLKGPVGATPAAHDITIRNSKAHNNTFGISLAPFTHHNKILNNELANNSYMSQLTPTSVNPDDDGGGGGIDLEGEDNEVAYNNFSGNAACTYDYGPDGISVEVYGAKRNNIHHNITNNDYSFVEIGTNKEKPLEHPTYYAEDTTLAYNLMFSSQVGATFLGVHGNGNFGPTRRTKAFNNTAYLYGIESQGVYCDGCNADAGSLILTLRNNILWAEYKGIYSNVPLGTNESNNIFYCAPPGTPLKGGCSHVTQITGGSISSTSKVINPQFVTVGSNFHLQPISYGNDHGTDVSLDCPVGCSTDLDTASVPAPPDTDIGAYQGAGGIPDDGDPTLSCSPASQSVQTGVNANLTAVNGDASSVWSASGGASGTGVNFSVSFLTVGSKNVSVKSGDGSQQDTCVVDITSSGGDEPPPAAVSAFKYLYVVDADFQHFTIWATLEDKDDKQIHDKSNATCKKVPPDPNYNYCIGD